MKTIAKHAACALIIVALIIGVVLALGLSFVIRRVG